MLRLIFIFSLLAHFFITSTGYALSLDKVNPQQDSSFVELLKAKASAENLILFFNPNWFESIKPPDNYTAKSLKDLLDEVLPGIGLKTITFEPNYMVIVKDIRSVQFTNGDHYESEKKYSDYRQYQKFHQDTNRPLCPGQDN